MPARSARLQLPLGNYIGGRGPGTIKTIEAGVFQTVDDRFPLATEEMTIAVDNAPVFVDNTLVWI